MNTKEMIEVMQAYVDGEEIEFMEEDSKFFAWRSTTQPSWDWHNTVYRIKQQKPTVNWGVIDTKWNYAAVDGDGGVCLYTHKPAWDDRTDCWSCHSGSVAEWVRIPAACNAVISNGVFNILQGVSAKRSLVSRQD